MSEPLPIDHMDEQGEYRAQVRASVLAQVGGHAEPISHREQLIGTWEVFFNRSLMGLPPERAFVYQLRPDGTCTIELVRQPEQPCKGTWRLNADATFSLLTWCPPVPEYGITEPQLDEARYHLLGLSDGRRVLWNGDGSVVMVLSPAP